MIKPTLSSTEVADRARSLLMPGKLGGVGTVTYATAQAVLDCFAEEGTPCVFDNATEDGKAQRQRHLEGARNKLKKAEADPRRFSAHQKGMRAAFKLLEEAIVQLKREREQS